MRKTRFSADEIAMALRLAHAGTPAQEIDRLLGIDREAVETPPIESIAEESMRGIARDVFGSGAQVAAIEPILPLRTHGLERRGGFTGNLLYKVSLAQPSAELVFRFNRGFREDVYDHEVASYRRVAAATGVRTPQILRVDRSQRLAPTSYMVLEFLHGENWSYLCHPDNPETSAAEKVEIRRKAGEFFALLHAVTQPASDPMQEAHQVLFGLYRLGDAIAAGHVAVDLDELARCRRVVETDPLLRTVDLSLCLSDGEICFARSESGCWEIAFVCDLEWVGDRDRYSDLVLRLSPRGALWEAERPLVIDDPESVSADAFFRGYQARREIDYARLLRLPVYYQLSMWGHAVADGSTPERARWIRRHKAPLIRDLVAQIAAREHASARLTA